MALARCAVDEVVYRRNGATAHRRTGVTNDWRLLRPGRGLTAATAPAGHGIVRL
jgi:hypothetical protein